MSKDTIYREDAIKAIKRISENYTGKSKRNYHPHIDFLVDELMYAVPSADRPQGEWIPCEERLPDNHADVLVTGIEAINNKRVYKVMCWDVDTWRPLNYAPSIHWDAWMPLPKPYGEREGE